MTNRYGVPYSGMSKELSDKTNITKLKLYGTINVTRKYDYYGVFFDSSWELAVWIYCIDNNIPIIRNLYDINKEDKYRFVSVRD